MITHFNRETPVELVGRKGHNLSLMWQAGLPVPPGFCIPWDEIDSIQTSELDRSIRELGSASFAVRSSAICEDAIDASFAGIMLSRLNITSMEGILSALQEIRDSVSAPPVTSYSGRLKIAPSPRIAAVIQAFLPSEASGVVFMREPKASSARFVVEACWGLGSGVVEGLVRPDRWILSSDSTIISEHIADKDIAVVPRENEGTTQTAVLPSCRRRPCLTLESLRELSQLAVECERLFGSPQDIEWALFDTRMWLLQSRPITTAK